MKKKILAMLLACVMVISLLPATTFAAEETVLCPGKGEDHNLSNATPAEEVLQVVEANCGDWGYTLYECADCGDTFADEFVAPEGEHVWEVTTEGTAAGCESAGVTAVETCEVCGGVRGGEEIPAGEGHVWEKVEAVEGEDGCTVKYACECGATKEEEGSHNWITPPVVTLEPTYYDDGIATYTCDDCGKTKEVVILCEHVCTEFKETAAKDATCTAKGNTYYKQCKECKTYYNEAGAKIDKDSWVLAKLGHDYSKEDADHSAEWVASTCTVKGHKVLICTREGCEQTKKFTLPLANHSYDPTPTFKQAATCTKYGFELYACVECGKVKEVVTQDPLGHTPFECDEHGDECTSECVNYGSVIVTNETPSCTVSANQEWRCGRCDAWQSNVLPAVGHDVKTVTKSATCAQYAYTYTYCGKAWCDLEETQGNKISTYVDKDKDGNVLGEFDVTVNDKAVVVLSFEANYEGGKNPDAHTKDENQPNEVITPATCTEDGNEVYYCKDCSWHGTAIIEALGHNYDATVEDNVTVKTEANCTTDKVITVNCKNEGCTAKQDQTIADSALGHKMGEEQTKAPTCTNPGLTWKECEREGCDKGEGFWVEIASKPALGYDPLTTYYSKDEALKAHNFEGETVEWTKIREATCTITALEKTSIPCADCGYYLLYADPETGLGHVEPDWEEIYESYGSGGQLVGSSSISYRDDEGRLWTNGMPATCLVDGYTAAYVCSKCDVYVESTEIKAKGEHTKEIDDEAKEVTCQEDGRTEGWHCTECDYKVESEVIPAGTCLMMSGVCYDYQDLSCTEFGYKHDGCRRCGYEYIWDYAPATGHNYKGKTTKATCEADGKIVYTCKNGCGDTYEEVIPATGHKNADDEVLVNICTNDVEDRYCVNCETEIAQTHPEANYTYNEYVEATCTDPAHTLEACTLCGLYEVTQINDELAEHSWVIDPETSALPSFHAAGVFNGYCSVCGEPAEGHVMEALQGLGTIITVDNAVVSGAELVDSGKVAVTVTLDGNNCDVWGAIIPVFYDDDVLTFEKFEVVSDTFTNTYATNLVDQEVEYNGEIIEGDYVNIVATVANDGDKQAQNTTIDGTHDVVVLYFTVDCGGLSGESYIVVPGIEAIEADTTVVYTEDPMILIACGYNYAEYEVELYLDYNDDGFVNLPDLKYVYDIICAGSLPEDYDASVDVNKDGVINLYDLDKLYRYISQELTYADMLNGGVKVEE